MGVRAGRKQWPTEGELTLSKCGAGGNCYEYHGQPEVTNREVLERIKSGLSLEAKITRLRLIYFGHVMRANSLEKSIMLGMVSGNRRRGRPRTRWLDTIKADTNMNIRQLKEAVLDRIAWRTLAYKVAESRTRLKG